MGCISEFNFPKCYQILYFQKFSWESDLFYLKEYFRMKDLGTSLLNCCNLVSSNSQGF